MIGFLVDKRSFTARYVQTILQAAWDLRGDISVIEKGGQFNVVQFELAEEYKEYIVASGPCCIKGACWSFFIEGRI